MFDRKPSWGAFILTFAAGALTGAALALLYAPYTGKKMQRKVGDVTGRMMDAVEDQVENVQGFVRNLKKG